jgi:hypothetical protein
VSPGSRSGNAGHLRCPGLTRQHEHQCRLRAHPLDLAQPLGRQKTLRPGLDIPVEPPDPLTQIRDHLQQRRQSRLQPLPSAGRPARRSCARSRRSPAPCWRWRRSPGAPSTPATAAAVGRHGGDPDGVGRARVRVLHDSCGHTPESKRAELIAERLRHWKSIKNALTTIFKRAACQIEVKGQPTIQLVARLLCSGWTCGPYTACDTDGC